MSPALSVSLATCDFSACGAAGAAASAAATTSPRAIVCFIENPPSELGYEWQQELTPCHSSNTTGMPKIFHTPCAGEIEGASVVQAAHQRVARGRRQTFVQRGGITKRGCVDGSWPEGQSSCSAWPFVQVIISRSKPWGQEAPKASADRGGESQIRERGEVCVVLPSWRP